MRNLDLSVNKFIKNLMPERVEVTDGYPVDNRGEPAINLKVPSVAIERVSITVRPHQLAGPGLIRVNYIISVYGRSKVERDELATTIQMALDRNHIPVYDFSAGYVESAPRIGALVINDEVKQEPIYSFQELISVPTFWQAEVSFSAYYSQEEF